MATTFRIILRAGPGDVPAIVRLRRFLKAALRGHGLVCVSAVELPAEDKPGDKRPPSSGSDERP